MRILKKIIVVALAALIASCNLVKFERKVKSTIVEDIRLENVKNGEYVGSYDLGLASATVKVAVADGRIQKLTLMEHTFSEGYSAEEVTESILAEQTVNADAVSGATGSSTAIKKAVELALKKGVNHD